MNILDHLLAWTSRSFFRNRALMGRTGGSQKKEIVNLVLGGLAQGMPYVKQVCYKVERLIYSF